MALLQMFGFEVGIQVDTIVPGRQIDGQNASGNVAVARNTGTVRSGAGSCLCAGSNANTSIWEWLPITDQTTATTRYYAIYMRFSALPSATDSIVRLRQDTTALASVRLTSAGKLQLFNDVASSQIGSDSVQTIAINTWFRVVLAFTYVSGGDDTVAFKLNDEIVASGTAALTASAASHNFQAGWITDPGLTSNMFLDDFTASDSSGSEWNSWPPEAKVVCLFATADSARATLWTGGAGGTTNLWDAVNNVPPAGTATETNTSQIEHAGGAAGSTDAYDATMTTYTAAGITDQHEILALQPILNHGEDAASGNKLLSFEVLSNPAAPGASSFNVAPTSGALGTWSANWWTTWGSVAYQPSVTLGTAPVMRVVRPETAAGVASVDFMGIHVAYRDRPPPGQNASTPNALHAS
jgi:hypothetical protein